MAEEGLEKVSPMPSTKEKLFWTLQVLCWLIFALVNGGLNGFVTGRWSVVLINSLVGVWGFAATLAFRHFIHRRGWKNYTLSQLIGPALLGIVVVAFVWIGASMLNAYLLAPLFGLPRLPILGMFIGSMISGLLITGIWTVSYFSYHFFRKYTQSEIEKWKLEATLKEAQLAGLRTQINPHFMFNALNNIRALILEDGHKARLMLTHLSDLLRYSLAETQNEKVSLKTELETVDYFMALNSIQFEEKLQFKTEIEEGLEEIKIPPMLIQLMIENAIKHGISHQMNGGLIRLAIQKQAAYLSICVENTGQLSDTASKNGTGVGIKNIRARLALMYNEQAHFSLQQKAERVTATTLIPI